VTLGLAVGGQEKLLVEFARHADRTRFDLHVISLTTRGRLAGEIETCGWRVTCLEEPPGVRPGMILRLARLFRKHRFGVVHTHDDKPLLYAAAAARLAGVPRVYHTQHHGTTRPLRLRQAAALKVAAGVTAAFICVSEDSARGVIQQGVPARKVATIWNGIDTARFTYIGPCSGGPAVAVARLSPEKDIGTLLQALALVRRQHPSFSLALAGDGPCMPALRQLATDLGLAETVAFLGEVRDIPALVACASLFVLPSVTEGISLTLLEAMARGLPVVATKVGGNPEVVVEGETGVLVPARDPAALAAALLRLAGDREAGQRMGLAGRRRVERHFDVHRMVARYEALYLSTKSDLACRRQPADEEQADACGRG
jgi:glycosyltransferase involved in cell wall biosynthesis